MSYKDTYWRSLTPLQRSSQCIPQPQSTGPVIEEFQAVIDGALTHCALLYFMFDLKAAPINVVQRCLICEIILSRLELGHNVTEATKNVYSAAPADCAVGWQEPQLSRSVRLKTMDSGAMLQAIELNPA